jgi:hypothetical protein
MAAVWWSTDATILSKLFAITYNSLSGFFCTAIELLLSLANIWRIRAVGC